MSERIRRGAIATAVVLCAVATGVVVPGRVSAAPARGERTYVVRFASSVDASARAAIDASAGAVSTGWLPALHLERVRAPASAASVYRSSGLVGWAEPDRTVRAFVKPSDPLLPFQWALPRTGVFKAWKRETGTRNPVTVAVLDTGVDLSHPDLQGRLLAGFNFVNPRQDPNDDFGHGTHVAGIIAADPDNQIGVAGLSWGAKILPVKVLGASGSGDEFTLAEGIAYAVSEGATVINMSLGGTAPSCPQAFQAALQLAAARSVTVVASAGNSAQKRDPVEYPAACDGVVAVAATDARDRRAPFSESGSWVDVAAPGVGIMSTLPPGSRLSREADAARPGYGELDGTSMAAPQVSGLAALLLSEHPGWTPAQVTRRIESTAIDLGPKGRDPLYGFGRIDLARAVGTR